MKTALQELIEKWESEIGSYIPNTPIYKAFIDDAKQLLEKEKEQILAAMNYSTYREWKGIGISNEEYFNQTYNKEVTALENKS